MLPPGSWATSVAIRKTMQATRNRDTSSELAIRSAVHRLGLRYRVAQRVAPDCPWTADLVFARARVAVFVDGCYWHGCPEHFRLPHSHADYWQAKIAGNRRRDAVVNDALAERGWAVIRVWEHEPVAIATQRIAATVRWRLARSGQRSVVGARDGDVEDLLSD